MKPPAVQLFRLRYFPIQKRWRRLGPLFKSEESKSIWLPNMLEYMHQRAHDNSFTYKRDRDNESFPSCFDSCDWRFVRDLPGPAPEYWEFACHSACHWVADMCLYVASNAYPDTPWRIVTSDKHSTVWNGCSKTPVLFDVNFSAIGVSPKEAWELASLGRMLKPGQWLRPWCVPKKFK